MRICIREKFLGSSCIASQFLLFITRDEKRQIQEAQTREFRNNSNTTILLDELQYPRSCFQLIGIAKSKVFFRLLFSYTQFFLIKKENKE